MKYFQYLSPCIRLITDRTFVSIVVVAAVASPARSLVIDFETAIEPFGTIRHVETTLPGEGMIFDPAVLIDTTAAPWPPLLDGAVSSGSKVLMGTTTGTTIINAFRPDGTGGLLPFNFNGAFFSGFFDRSRDVTVRGYTQENVDANADPDFSTVIAAPPSITSGSAFSFGYVNVVRVEMLGPGSNATFMIDDFDFTPAALVPVPAPWASGAVALLVLGLGRLVRTIRRDGAPIRLGDRFRRPRPGV